MAWLVGRKDRKGRTIWHVHWRDDAGRHRSKSTGSTSKRYAESIRRTVESRAVPAPGSAPETIDSFLVRVSHELAPATVGIYANVLRWASEAMGDDVTRWTQEAYLSWLAAMRDKGSRPWGPATVRQVNRVLRRFSRWGKARGVPDMTRDFRPRSARRVAPATLSREDRRRLVEGAGDRLRAAVALAAGMGLRPREWRTAQASDVDRASRKLRVRGHKVRRDRVLPIPPKVLGILTATSGPLVHPGLLDLTPTGARNALYRECARLEVPRVTWYGLRHTCATLMAERHPLHVVQRWLGHASLMHTQVYLHAQERDLRAAAEDF